MDKNSENISDTEDIPSDFFDDFNKEEFIQGLSVIDTWDNDEKQEKRNKINAEAIDSVKDLRELIEKSKYDENKSNEKRVQDDSIGNGNNLDEYIKPGSRRDPSKTKEAIKRDKEVKVKEYLAKHLDSGGELRPPGTELDDFFGDGNLVKKKRDIPMKNIEESLPARDDRRHRSRDRQHSPPYKRPAGSRRSPEWISRVSPLRRSVRRPPSPSRRPRKRYSPRRSSPIRTKRMTSHHPRRSVSPLHRKHAQYNSHRSRSRSPSRRNVPYPESYPQMPVTRDYFVAPVTSEYPGGIPGYSCPPTPGYPPEYMNTYGYGPPSLTTSMPANIPPVSYAPQPVPIPRMNVAPAPSMVPAPTLNTELAMQPQDTVAKPYDALAQLVAEGKISQEDYLKLTPHKNATGVLNPIKTVDLNIKQRVLNRCNQALSILEKMILPNFLTMNNNILSQEQKSIMPKFSSPLKRQAVVEFHFAKTTNMGRNREIINNLISAIGLEKTVSRSKKKLLKETKDAAVQTTRFCCETCEVRNATIYYETGTSTELEHFTSSIHTQVIEQDLMSSKAVFNPSGGITPGTAMSMAHLTPAQLVSQLAARAKTLKQNADPTPRGNQFSRRNPYDGYDGRGGGQYQNYRY